MSGTASSSNNNIPIIKQRPHRRSRTRQRGTSSTSAANPPHYLVTSFNGNRLVLLAAFVFCMGSICLLPILILESLDATTSLQQKEQHVSVDRLIGFAEHLTRGKQLEKPFQVPSTTQLQQQQQQQDKLQQPIQKSVFVKESDVVKHVENDNNGIGTTPKEKKTFPKEIPTSLDELTPDVGFTEKPCARGVAGRPLVVTPALQGAKRAHVECDMNVDSLAYWNAPQGTRDETTISPYADLQTEKYISFAPDRGGWNNVRMSMEIIFVIAAATGRTLVLPPKEPLYLLQKDVSSRHRGFADFFPIHTAAFQKRVKTISFADFVKKEGLDPNGRLPVPTNLHEAVTNVQDHCDKREVSTASCTPVYEYLSSVGYNPEMSADKTCLVFDEAVFQGEDQPSAEVLERVKELCGNRHVMYWKSAIEEHTLLHFHADDKQYRLLTHFYGMIHFTNPKLDNFYRRFVRDFLHYNDSIYCAAGKVVKAVQAEGMKRGFTVDEEGAGAFSAMHVRRGDLQYKKVKIPASEWYNNTKEVWLPNEILYVATDERNKSFFDDLAIHHDLRFLDDYWELAGLGELDPNYMGMIDTIIASRGRAFAGTWFSTFSGYINRLRGYHGLSMMDSWYSFLPRKTAVHDWHLVDDFAYAYEWPDGWVGIDADEWPDRTNSKF